MPRLIAALACQTAYSIREVTMYSLTNHTALHMRSLVSQVLAAYQNAAKNSVNGPVHR